MPLYYLPDHIPLVFAAHQRMPNLSTYPRARIPNRASEHFEVSYNINPWMRQSQAGLLGARSSSDWGG